MNSLDLTLLYFIITWAGSSATLLSLYGCSRYLVEDMSNGCRTISGKWAIFWGVVSCICCMGTLYLLTLVKSM